MARLETDMVIGDRYRLARRIADGGMGSVWEAEDTVLHRRVAVKLLSEPLAADERSAERFRREALAAARLSHPGVASVYDYGGDGGPPFIVMELVHGETLAQLIRRRGRIPEPEAVRIAVAIADALQAAHDSGVVHRDVKPGNVMIRPSGEVVVLDFGISAAAGAPVTGTAGRMGTASYISPEQARGEPPTPASDVYSLGVVLYEMLAGVPPFTSESPVALAVQHVREPPPSLRERAPEVSPDVAAACERALAKDPADRPPSATAFAALLTATSDGSPADPGGGATEVLPPAEPTAVLGAGPSSTSPLPSVKRHRRTALVVACAALVLALIGTLALVALTGSDSGKGGGTVPVPAVIGMTRPQAERAIRDLGLEVGDVRPVQGVAGIVIGADPGPGSQVALGSTVTLYVGSGPGHEGNGNGEGKGKGKGKDGN